MLTRGERYTTDIIDVQLYFKRINRIFVHVNVYITTKFVLVSKFEKIKNKKINQILKNGFHLKTDLSNSNHGHP
jgi:hypothetical protein